MAYKAEHAVDLDSDIVVAATVHPGNAPDTQTIIDTAIDAGHRRLISRRSDTQKSPWPTGC
jgi:hypothetical protein